MELHVGLDVALESTSVCIVDEAGSKVLETSVASDPASVCLALKEHVASIARIGIEACSTGIWLARVNGHQLSRS